MREGKQSGGTDGNRGVVWCKTCVCVNMAWSWIGEDMKVYTCVFQPDSSEEADDARPQRQGVSLHGNKLLRLPTYLQCRTSEKPMCCRSLVVE